MLLRLLYLLLAVLLLAGCSHDPKPQGLDLLGASGDPEGRKVWPAPPETPRLRLAGVLKGPENFRYPKKEKGFGEKLLDWVAGLAESQSRSRKLVRPQCGMVDRHGRILVTDIGRMAVAVFDPEKGLSFWTQARDGQAFRSPVGIAPGPEGGYLVADAELGYIVRLDASGNPAGVWGEGELTRPTGLAWNPARQELFVADSGANRISVLDGKGRVKRSLGGPGTEKGRFNGPTHLAFRKQQLYVTDTLNARVQVLDRQGRHLRTIGQRGLYVGNLVRPKGVAVDRQGHVYVVESYYDHLLAFREDGRFLLPISGPGAALGEFLLPAGAWFGPGNRLFLADMLNSRIVVLEYLGGHDDSQS